MERVNPWIHLRKLDGSIHAITSFHLKVPGLPFLPFHIPRRTLHQIRVRLTFVTADGDIVDYSAVGFGNQTFFEISTEYRPNTPVNDRFHKQK